MSSVGERSEGEDVLSLIGGNENQDSIHGSGDELQGDPGELGGFEPQNSGDENAGQKVTPKVPKRAKSFVPRLTTELLKGPKGVHTIEKYFEGFKYKGKGHEKEDLDRIMKRLEHWSHRLFPKLNFNDCLEKIEQLGTKKDLQVFLKRYRTDMLTADDDVIRSDLVDDDADERREDSTPQEEFDLLLAEQIEKQRNNDTTLNTSAFDDLLASANALTARKDPEPALSDEVKERIERNRKLAMEKKLATMKRLQEEKAKSADDPIPSTSGINSSQQVLDSSEMNGNPSQKSSGDEEPVLDKENNTTEMIEAETNSEQMEEEAAPTLKENNTTEMIEAETNSEQMEEDAAPTLTTE